MTGTLGDPPVPSTGSHQRDDHDEGDSGRTSVAVTDVSYIYPDGTAALNGVSFQIDPGERVAFLGPNGSGKTTLALHLNGLLPLQTGSITIGGVPVVDANLADIRRQVGLVFQDPDDQLFMTTVRDDVAFGPATLVFLLTDLMRWSPMLSTP